MIVKYLSQKRRSRKIKGLPDEIDVVSGLVKTPKQVYLLSQSGIPVDINTSSEGYNDGAVESIHNEIQITDERSKDINHIWEAQQQSKKKIKDYQNQVKQ